MLPNFTPKSTPATAITHMSSAEKKSPKLPAKKSLYNTTLGQPAKTPATKPKE
jgi:hypothetical protein